jgi:hypothetical protein
MRNFEFGAYPPTQNHNIIEQQFRLAHAYQCALIMIERERRTEIDDLCKATCATEWAAWVCLRRSAG